MFMVIADTFNYIIRSHQLFWFPNEQQLILICDQHDSSVICSLSLLVSYSNCILRVWSLAKFIPENKKWRVTKRCWYNFDHTSRNWHQPPGITHSHFVCIGHNFTEYWRHLRGFGRVRHVIWDDLKRRWILVHLQWILKEKILIFLFCTLAIPLELTVVFRQMFFKQVKTRGSVIETQYHIWVLNKYM